MRYWVWFCLFLSIPIALAQTPDVFNIKQRITDSEPKTEAWFNAIMDLAEQYRPFPISQDVEDNGMPKEYYSLANDALEWAISQNDDLKVAKASRFLIDYHCYAKNIIELIGIAAEMVNRENFANLQDKHFIYLKLSEAYERSGFIKEYIEIIPELYETSRQLELLSSHVHEEYNQIALAYYYLKDYEKARQYFKKSLTNLKLENRPFASASVSNNIGLSFSKEEKIDSATYYFQNALEILKNASAEKEGFGENSYNTHFKNVVKANIAYLNIDSEKYSEAIEAINAELKTAKVENEILTEIQSYQKLAYIYYKSKTYDRALFYLNQAEQRMNPKSDNALRLQNWDLKAKILLVKGNQKQSDSIFKRKNKLQDSIASAEARRTARIASVIYEVKKKNLEIKNQQINIELLDAKNRAKENLLLFGSLGLISIFYIIALIWSRKTARKREKLQQNFSHALINAQETERNRLALDLHDSVGQQLMMLTRRSKRYDIKDLTDLATDTLSNLRAISRNLHPNTIKQLGFTAAVEQLVNKIDDETAIFVTLDLQNIDDFISTQQALHLYRIIQEVLSNIVKHSEAKSAEVNLAKVSNKIVLSLKDSGKGFDYHQKSASSSSLGMQSIIERSKILNANLKIVSKLNKGTLIIVKLPIEKNQDEDNL
jgi:signal transduction histidine kinase